jgi:DNA-binding transcriptional ArsR family regulator
MALPVITDDMSDDELEAVVNKATTASGFLKAISHEGRLMILCHLVTGEKSVTELEDLISARQAAVSQQLSRLRLEGLVIPRRDGKTIYYRLADDKPKRILEVVYELFCRSPH